jgi:hypothetical protein
MITYKHDIVGSLVRRNDNIFAMKRGKTLNSILVFKYRLRSTMNTIFEFVNPTFFVLLLIFLVVVVVKAFFLLFSFVHICPDKTCKLKFGTIGVQIPCIDSTLFHHVYIIVFI